jgi:hypothetical protein
MLILQFRHLPMAKATSYQLHGKREIMQLVNSCGHAGLVSQGAENEPKRTLIDQLLDAYSKGLKLRRLPISNPPRLEKSMKD